MTIEIDDESIQNLIELSWHKHLPGTKKEFIEFVGVKDTTIRVHWKDLEDLARTRFGLLSLGGMVRFPNSTKEDYQYKFRYGKEKLFWKKGVPNEGAWIDGEIIVGVGKTLDLAIMAVFLVLWEYTYRRAMV